MLDEFLGPTLDLLNPKLYGCVFTGFPDDSDAHSSLRIQKAEMKGSLPCPLCEKALRRMGFSSLGANNWTLEKGDSDLASHPQIGLLKK